MIVNTSEVEDESVNGEKGEDAGSGSACLAVLGEAEEKSGKKGVRDTTECRRVRSSASWRVDDIEGFLFGPGSTRFWMLRKHINSLEVQPSVPLNLPFYAW